MCVYTQGYTNVRKNGSGGVCPPSARADVPPLPTSRDLHGTAIVDDDDRDDDDDDDDDCDDDDDDDARCPPAPPCRAANRAT